MRKHRLIAAMTAFALSFCLLDCVGGGGSSSPTSAPVPAANQSLSIMTSTLPIGVQGLAYSATLVVANASLPVSWSLDNSSPQLPAGLSLNTSSGVISGTPTISGNFNLVFRATDSSATPKSVNQALLLIVNLPLSWQAYSNVPYYEYQSISQFYGSAYGGVPPYSFSLVQGSLPPGTHLASNTGNLTGVPYAAGAFSFSLQIQDSYSPPETVTQPINITVAPPQLQITNALNNARLLLNRPFTSSFVAVGGTPPYSFSIVSGTLPPGISLSDPSTGMVSGTPTTSGTYSFNVGATDAASSTVYQYSSLSVAQAVGRNDTPGNAARIGNSWINASISPLVGSSGDLVPDTDYYKLLAAAGSTVTVETFAKRSNPNNPLDTVIEITDVNGARFTTGCNQPGGSTTDFSSACLNDDISGAPHVQDSQLAYKVPGMSGSQTFLVHVLDWSGSARPDMTYGLSVNGVINPITFLQNNLVTGIVNQPYTVMISATGGTGALTYSLASGSLPPGLTFTVSPNNTGATITGTPSSAGSSAIGVQVVDQTSPPQQVTGSFTIAIANPLIITTSSLPDGYVGTAYSFQLTSTGGIGPIQWTAVTLPAGLSISSTGLISGVPTSAGPYFFPMVFATDMGSVPSGSATSKSFQLTVH